MKLKQIKEFDNLHLRLNKLNSYNKSFNCIVSAREAGKSTAYVTDIFRYFMQDRSTFIICKRKIKSLSEIYIESIIEIIKKFYDTTDIEFNYNKTELSKGHCLLKVIDLETNESWPFILFLCLKVDLDEMKSLMMPRIKWIIFDEFICNTKLGEKYLKNETFKFSEMFKTFQRENRGLKVYFFGNPYSKYNPYFVYFGFDIGKIKQGTIVTSDKAVVWNYKLSDELIAFIKENDPLYELDDSYTSYAYDGDSVNDRNINLLDKLPDGYKVGYIIKTDGVYIIIRYNTIAEDDRFAFIVNTQKDIKEFSSSRQIYFLNYSELFGQNPLLIYPSRPGQIWQSIQLHLARNNVGYLDLQAYYMILEIFNLN